MLSQDSGSESNVDDFGFLQPQDLKHINQSEEEEKESMKEEQKIFQAQNSTHEQIQQQQKPIIKAALKKKKNLAQVYYKYSNWEMFIPITLGLITKEFPKHLDTLNMKSENDKGYYYQVEVFRQQSIKSSKIQDDTKKHLDQQAEIQILSYNMPKIKFDTLEDYYKNYQEKTKVYVDNISEKRMEFQKNEAYCFLYLFIQLCRYITDIITIDGDFQEIFGAQKGKHQGKQQENHLTPQELVKKIDNLSPDGKFQLGERIRQYYRNKQ